MSLLGIIVSLMGFVYSIIVIILHFNNQTPFKGYAPIMMLLLIVSGLIMFMLEVIGEYLWRIYDEVRRRPLYIIKDMFI
jgi:dolichol-phosphate mannosyltransferase